MRVEEKVERSSTLQGRNDGKPTLQHIAVVREEFTSQGTRWKLAVLGGVTTHLQIDRGERNTCRKD